MLQLLSVGSRKRNAFTIVEIMTVVIISALLITVALPAYNDFMRNSQSLTMASRLASSLRTAKAEAIKRGIPVTVCPISSSFNPTADFNETTEEWPCQNSTDWTAWKVFADPNFDATEDFSNGWPIIEYVGNNQPSSIVSNIAAPITFDPMGFANINPVTTRAGWTWSSSYSSGEWQWNYSYGSTYSGSYYRAFTISPNGCSGNNAHTVEVTQNGVITVNNSAC